MGSLLRALSTIVSLLLCAVIATGCSDEEREEAGEGTRATDGRRATTPSPPSYEPIEVVNGGTITGSVQWAGERPAPIEIAVPMHAARCGESQRSPAIEISRRGGVSGTVVWLEGIRRGRALQVPAEPVVVSIADCGFRPHVVAVPVGARVAWRNDEPILHNVHASFFERARPPRSWFSEGLPEQGASHEVTIERAGAVRVVDDAGHPWMLGWVHAFEHPYFAVSDAEGRFQLTGIPPGQYVVRVWHEGFLTSGATESGRPVYSAPIVMSRPVTVSTGHDTPVDFEVGVAAALAAGE
ncbi:carboxypeptidase regulatory-like domain-containing protein [Sandaracinus amylolyticus]|uniref:carboxypeptidase regulatory-like domain-containing protein n=1 Tax=Sandaracinus amylolyticus TaxID=927083 RepID=UPI00069E3A3F|nr:carboxypeptidase regulatory-like domain-containing protein [Sandaracinus amylolyticus]